MALPLPIDGPVLQQALSRERPDPQKARWLSRVQRITERTRESIQGMLQALLKERRSVFAG
ncbi:hypothetical protein KYC5002_28735 [Archangium violaceum]|uniref:hypothetical protein n=1 Tax=Archangium violaceum TaxID=83451 RepID=UPI002B2FE52B|nr:hypothetical protein KYC5002_28735 [Archangium gephyra]